MQDFQIRKQVRTLYWKNPVAFLLIGLAYSVFAQAISDWLPPFVALAVGLLLAPLSLGAVRGALLLFDGETFSVDTLLWYYHAGHWKRPLLLFVWNQMIALAATLGSILLLFLLVNWMLAVVAAVLVVLVIWFLLRLAMAETLIVVDESLNAGGALSQSFRRMRGWVLGYLMFYLSVYWPVLVVQFVLTGMGMQMMTTTLATALVQTVICMIFVPYMLVCTVVWLRERIREQNQTADLLSGISSDVQEDADE